MPALSKECKLIRKDAGVRRSSIAHEIEKGQSVIDRFEREETWPVGRDIDALVNAYSELCHTPAAEIWQLALNRAMASEATDRMDAAKDAAKELGAKRRRNQ